MFDLGFQELIVIFAVALMVFGPKKLPELAQNLGKGVAHLKKALFDVKQEINKEAGINLGEAGKSEFPDWKQHALEQIYGKDGFPMPGGAAQGVNPAEPVQDQALADQPEPEPSEQQPQAPQVHNDDIEGSEAQKVDNPS